MRKHGLWKYDTTEYLLYFGGHKVFHAKNDSILSIRSLAQHSYLVDSCLKVNFLLPYLSFENLENPLRLMVRLSKCSWDNLIATDTEKCTQITRDTLSFDSLGECLWVQCELEKCTEYVMDYGILPDNGIAINSPDGFVNVSTFKTSCD